MGNEGLGDFVLLERMENTFVQIQIELRNHTNQLRVENLEVAHFKWCSLSRPPSTSMRPPLMT